MDEWMVTAQLAARGYRPRGAGIGAVTVSGGEAGYLLELAEDCGVHFPPLSAPGQKRLGAQFPAFREWSNPADGWDKGPWEEVIPAMLAALADEPAVDVLVAAIDVPAAQGAHEADYTSVIGRVLGEHAARTGKPAVYLSLAGGALDERVRAALRAHGTPLVGGARWGLRALSHLAAFAAARERRDALDAPAHFATDVLDGLIDALPAGPADESLSRRVFARAGLPLVPAVEVADEPGAVAAAADLAAPAVLKAIIPGQAHKSDVGAVALRLTSPAEVRQAAGRLLALCDRHGAPRRLLVSPYLEPAAELICGVTCDPAWGAFVVLGLGGVLAEALDEVVIAAVPLHWGQAEALVTGGRLGRVLTSARRPADVPALVRLVRRLGWLAHHLWRLGPSIVVDLNPVLLMPPGQGAWAADTLITRGPATPPPAHLLC
jgi:acyl-CoA synthetase (NDP forming)